MNLYLKDIRKFFGGTSSAPKRAESKKQNIKDTKSETKTKPKPAGKVTQKSSASNKKSTKSKDPLPDEDIIINDSSDEDVIPSSMASNTSSKNNNNDIKESKKSKKSKEQKEDVRKKEISKSRVSHQSEQDDKDEIKERSVSDKGSKVKGKQEKSKDKAKASDSKQKLYHQDSSTGNERRMSPRKQKSTTFKSELTSKEKLKKENSNSSVEIVADSSDEESPIGKKKTKGKPATLKRKSKIFDSDSEEDPLPQEKPKSKKKKSGISYINDSDDEKKETALDKFVVHKSTPDSVKEKKIEAKKSTPVNLVDFFGGGSTSASRKERSSTSAKRKLEEKMEKEESKTDVTFDEEIHDDEDFLKTLDQLDGPAVKKSKFQESSPKKSEGGTLASKLAGKVKATKEGSGENQDSKTQKKSPSPAKKSTTPSKDLTSVKKGKTYTMEVMKKKIVKTIKDAGGKKEEVTPAKPPKPAANQKSSEKKKAGDAEDDGFGLKKSSSFRAFKMRGGPLALGSKEIPEGEENCLEGLTFVVTGVLDSIERDDTKSLVEKHGGKVTTSISKKTSYVVVGREPGESKLKKAQDLKINQIDEDGLFDLIRTLPGKTSKYEVQAKEHLKKEATIKAQKEKASKKLQSFRMDKNKGKEEDANENNFTQLKKSETAVKEEEESMDDGSSQMKSEGHDVSSQPESLMWVDKHKPTSLKQIIGQHGNKSNANKLLHWIKHWHENVIVKGLKAAGNFFGGKGDGTGFRAALLSGPPGIGKTTTATLVCKEAGFSYVELNASDTRSKRSLKEVVAESLDNQTLVDYMGDTKKKDQGQCHCLIMDEVDGMAGNEDRGGLQELVQLIKSSKIPIICICNDRNSMKMRTLANHCFDLRFSRPRVEQIKGAMMTLAFREGLKIPPSAVQEIIMASNHDIRQIIHNLSMWSAGDKQLTYEQVKSDARKAQKDLKIGPFDVCRKIFVIDDETSKMSINDKSDLFFQDYSFGPLFVHENYPHVIPAAAKGDNKRHMACLARSIDSLCDGDLVEKLIRRGGNWNLLPTQAMYSSVIPGEFMRGRFPQMTEFPSWLGKNSSTGKTDRILQELNRHMHLQVSCDKRGLGMDYLPALRVRLTAPLLDHGGEGVPQVIELMDDYDIIKEDFDNIMEVTKWPGSVDPVAKLESKTKAAFTRQYNKGSHLTPYSTGATSKKRGRGVVAMDESTLLVEPGDELPVVQESEEEDDEPAVVAKPKAGTSKGKQTAGKGKATKGRK